MIDSNETQRSGLNIRTALQAYARRLERQRQSASASGAAHAPSGAQTLKSSIKKALRPAAAALYGLVKRVLRPLAYRLRGFLLAPLQTGHTQALEEKLQRLSHELRELRLEHVRSIEQRKAEIASIGQQMTRELDVIRDTITRAASESDIALNGLQRIEQYSLAAARRMAVPGVAGEILVRTSVGYVLCPASDYPLVAMLLDTGEVEIGSRLLIQKLLRPGDTFVDVGANVGMHTLAAARAMNGSGRVIAFEPHPGTHALLAKSVLLNGFTRLVETHQAAVSNRAGDLPLHIGPTSSHHSLYRLEGEGATATTIEVPLVKLDDVVANWSVDLIKIDVEGAELDVLAGAAGTIARNAEVALVVEYGGSHLRRTGHSSVEWFKAFEQHGFIFRAIEPQTGTLLDWSPAQIDSVDSINLLFARPASKAWARAQDRHDA